MISPKDWLVIERWQEEGIPLQIVLRGIENTFKHVDSSAVGGKSKIHRVSYCEAEIRDLWEKSSSHPLRSEQEEFSLVGELDRIITLLSDAVSQQEGEIAKAISDYADEVGRMRDETAAEETSSQPDASTSLEEFEIRLREGYVQLANRLYKLVEREELETIQQEVEAKLKNYRRSMEPEAYRKTFQAILRDRLLESVGISELSIISLIY